MRKDGDYTKVGSGIDWRKKRKVNASSLSLKKGRWNLSSQIIERARNEVTISSG